MDDLIGDLSMKAYISLIREDKFTYTTYESQVTLVPYVMCDACGSNIGRGSMIQNLKWYNPENVTWEVFKFCDKCGAN